MSEVDAAPDEAAGPIDEWQELQRDRLVAFIRADFLLTLVSAVYVFGIYLFAARRAYLLAAVGAVLLCALAMYAALRAARRGDTSPAVARLAAANWGVVLAAAFLAAPVWPVLVLAALLPVTAAASYVREHEFRRYLVVSVVVAAGCTVLGLFTSATSIEDDLPSWTVDSVLMIFVPLLTAMVGFLAVQNFARIRSALDTLTDTNERLRQQSGELSASRARMVLATDLERRRIERDLHDGTQQHFVSMGLRLGAIRRAVAAEDPGAGELIDGLKTEIREAQSQLRDFTLGIYPPTLTQHGLAAALRRAVDRIELEAVIDIDEVGRFDPAVEASVYFICLEALQNADKHAGAAATIRLSLACADGFLRFEVADDGVGFDQGSVTHRSGTQNMEDRIDSVNGVLDITSTTGAGTAVRGSIPVTR